MEKNNPENARTKSREKSITSYVIGYRNSSKKLESLDQSGILLCRNNDCDVIKAYLQQIQLRGKKVFFFSVSSRANKWHSTWRIYENYAYKANFLIRDSLSKDNSIYSRFRLIGSHRDKHHLARLSG